MKTLKLSQLIQDRKFDWVNSDITDDLFKLPKKLRTDFKIFHFDKYISSENAILEMKKVGYEPANIYELLSWKDWNNTDLVVALGSVGEVGGSRYVPYLSRSDSGRSLGLYWFGGDWRAYCRFLGVRSLSSESKVFRDSLAYSKFETLTLNPHDLESINAAIEFVKKMGYQVSKIF